jgi:hypothetical protein
MRGLLVFILLHLSFILVAQQTIHHWEMAVKASHSWRYHIGTTAPPGQWSDKEFDDSGWNEGPGGIGYGDDDDGTVITQTPSVFLRIKFTIHDLTQIEEAQLLADYDDAFVAYLNGTEVARSGIAGNPPGHDQFAETTHEASLHQGLYPDIFTLTKDEIAQFLVEGENTMAVQVHNANISSSDLSSNFYLAIGLNVADNVYEPVTGWFKDPNSAGNLNLPLVLINTGGRSIPDEPKIAATMKIIHNENGEPNEINDEPNVYDGHIGIEIRGSSSQMFPKKQYAVETWTATGQDTSVAMLGLPKEEDWVLYAPYSDKSLLRNVLAYKFSGDLGHYSPRTRFVEVYLNGAFQGVYVLTEKIKRDRNRVDVSKLNPDENTGDDLTGGYIVKLDKFDGATQGLGWSSPFAPPNRAGNQEVYFQYHYPREDQITSTQAQYIQNFITNFEEALAGPDWLDGVKGYRNLINVGSFIDFALVNEISKNVDGYRLSTFLFKDKSSQDGRLHIGPVWDFNLAFGNADYCQGGSTQGWAWDFNNHCNSDYWLIPFWWSRLMRDPHFKMQMKARWQEVRAGVFSNESIMQYIDSVVVALDGPQQRNFERWPVLNQYIWPNNYVGGTYEREVVYLKDWIRNRLTWLDNQIGAFETVTDLNSADLTGERVSVYPNPGNGDFTIHFPKGIRGSLSLSLHDQLGRKLATKHFDAIDPSDQFTVVNPFNKPLAKGMYILKILDEHNRQFHTRLLVN